jgi:hypothetical protein
MTKKLAGLLGAATLTMLCSAALMAQVASAPPTITAENETWYLSGGPVSLNGGVYYPAGAVIHFVRNEMVRTGILGNTPVYVRTTQEPGSIIYVPLAGGLMRPYERRRSGELAGTSGSSAPSFVVALPAAETAETALAGLQAAVPPTGAPVPVGTTGVAAPAAAASEVSAPAPSVPSPVGTSGLMQVSANRPVRTRIETAQRPVGLNNVFIEFQNARWFAAGPAVEFSSSRFTRVGEHRGFAVYQESGRTGTIYLSLLDGAPGLLAPYKTR